MNQTTRSALEAAADYAWRARTMTWKSNTSLMKLLEGQGSDFALILQHYGVDRSRLTTELQRSLDRLKSGNPARRPSVLRC